MSAEPWRRSGTPVAPRLFAWQAWCFGGLRLDLRGRCGTSETFVDVRRTLATKRGPCGAAAFCVAGVVLWGPQARFAWQVWYFQDLHRCPRKLGDELGRMDAAAFRGRRDTFSTSGSICVAGVALSGPYRCPRKLGDELGRMDAAAFDVAGVTLSAPQARFAWQVWRFQDLYRCPRKLGDELGRMDAAALDVAGVTLSAPQARFAWQAWHFQYLHIDVRGSSATNWAWRDTFSTSCSICVAGVTLSVPP